MEPTAFADGGKVGGSIGNILGMLAGSYFGGPIGGSLGGMAGSFLGGLLPFERGGDVRGHFNYAAGGAAPVIKAGRKASKRNIGAARAKARAPAGGLTRPLDLSSAVTARPGFLSRNANV
jgi:hypothetical protein